MTIEVYAAEPQYREAYAEMSDQFRRSVTAMFDNAQSITIFRDLPAGYKVNAFITGTMIALLTVIIISTRKEKLDETMRHIAECVPLARAQAEMLIQIVESNK